LRIPYRLLGAVRAFALHDFIVARRLERLGPTIDIVHAWPMGALQTLRAAARLGIPTVLERPNAHTRFAYEVVRQECERIGVALPSDHEHAYKQHVIDKEELEYGEATRLLCPSDFVAASFLRYGFAAERLARHQYGFDQSVFHPDLQQREAGAGLSALFVGGCAPRKGLHFALQAWLRSTACKRGRFRIVGAFVAGYAERLGQLLVHPSVEVLGHRHDVPRLMRNSDVLLLPTIEEGSALVTSEARGSGCVLLVSEAAGAVCQHMSDALVHPVGDVAMLAEHLSSLDGDRGLLERLRANSLASVDQITWLAAGQRLLEVYRETITMAREARAAEHHSFSRS
jgi:glycosyltransferase involved in cell wall biosynthesis